MFRVACVLSLLLAPIAATAEPAIRVIGQSEVVVTGSEVRLGDIAAITADATISAETSVGLNRLFIAAAPEPGQSKSIQGDDIVQTMRFQGIDLSQIGYLFPKSMQVTRAARQISEGEVRAAIEELLSVQERDATLRSVSFKPALVSTRDLTMQASSTRSTGSGQRARGIASHGQKERFEIVISSKDARPVVVVADAELDEFAEVPQLARSLEKGRHISPDDFVLARLNLNTLPRDAVTNLSELMGLQTGQALDAGSVVRRSQISIPNATTAGKRVTMLYRAGPLEITAFGLALESVPLGTLTKVQNMDSKKVIFGVVTAENTVTIGGVQ